MGTYALDALIGTYTSLFGTFLPRHRQTTQRECCSRRPLVSGCRLGSRGQEYGSILTSIMVLDVAFLGLENSKFFMIVGIDIGKSLFLDLENFTSFVDLIFTASCGTSSPADVCRPAICIPILNLIDSNFVEH